jgi:hypothetical protein
MMIDTVTPFRPANQIEPGTFYIEPGTFNPTCLPANHEFSSTRSYSSHHRQAAMV